MIATILDNLYVIDQGSNFNWNSNFTNSLTCTGTQYPSLPGSSGGSGAVGSTTRGLLVIIHMHNVTKLFLPKVELHRQAVDHFRSLYEAWHNG